MGTGSSRECPPGVRRRLRQWGGEVAEEAVTLASGDTSGPDASRIQTKTTIVVQSHTPLAAISVINIADLSC
jgi:hypothetical protein